MPPVIVSAQAVLRSLVAGPGDGAETSERSFLRPRLAVRTRAPFQVGAWGPALALLAAQGAAAAQAAREDTDMGPVCGVVAPLGNYRGRRMVVLRAL